MSYLAETLRGESHGAPELDAGVFEQRVARDERKQAQRAYQHSLEGYVESRAVGEKALGAVARGTLHNAAVGHLRAEREGGERVGDEIYKEELYRQKRRGHSEERRRKDAEYLADIAAEQIVYRAADVVVYPAPPGDCLDYSCEIVVGQNHVGGVLRHLRAALAHGAADVGGLEGGRVVYPVACHGDYLAVGAQSLDYPHLVLGRYPRIYAAGAHGLSELVFAHFVYLRPR